MTAAAILARFPRPRLQPPRWSSGGIDGATFNLAPDAAAFLRVLAGNPEPWPPPSESTHWIIWPVNDHQPRRELEERLRAFVVRVGLALGNYTLTSTDREVRLAVNPGVAVDDGKWEAEWLRFDEVPTEAERLLLAMVERAPVCMAGCECPASNASAYLTSRGLLKTEGT